MPTETTGTAPSSVASLSVKVTVTSPPPPTGVVGVAVSAPMVGAVVSTRNVPRVFEPWVALLPGLDSTVMGWKDRDWYLGEGAEDIFDRHGNAGPTIWMNGRVVGGWAQGAGGEVRIEFTEPVAADAADLVDGEAQRLEAWLGGARVTTRFPSPMSKRIAGRGSKAP